MPAPLVMHCSWHYTIKISDKRHLLLLWRLAHYFISAFTVPWHLSIRLHFFFFFCCLLSRKMHKTKGGLTLRRSFLLLDLNATTFECKHAPLCSLVLVRMARDHLFVFVDKLWLGSTEVYPPPLLFLALFTSLCDYIMTKGRGKMKRTNMLRRTR